MIILDENVHQQRIQASVASWYGGQVRSITTLRPNTLINDDAIPSLLLLVSQPTFVTTNVDDFWRRMSAHSRFSMVCMALPNERLHELSTLLRQLLRRSEFSTRAKRMGKIIRVSPSQLQYYERQEDHIIRVCPWSI